MREYAAILALISAALVAWVLGSEADEIGFRDFAVFAVALVVILTVQLLLLYLLNRLLEVVGRDKKDLFLLVVTAAFLAANTYFLAFYTLELPTATRLAYSGVVGIGFLILMSFARIRPVLALFTGVMLVMSLAQFGYTRATFGGSVDVTADTVSLPVNSQRNVYIIGFESLQSPTAYRENFDIQEAEPAKVLRNLGFRVLERAYSAERSTLRSYSRVFEFKRDYRGSDLGARSVFADDNSTFRSFRDGNYAIQMLYKNSYFPVNTDKVDYLFPPPAFDACDELGAPYFYGLCSKEVVATINNYVFGAQKITWKPQITLLQQRTDFVLSSSRPWFTWTHIKYPFHTHGYYRHPDPEYAAKFKRRVHDAMPIIAENMRKTAGYIVAKDPDAVVIVMGDHGPHFLRGDEDKVRKQVFSNAPLWPLKAVLEDQHGVMLAVYPANFCLNRMSEPFSTRFLMENVIACLNGDDSPSEEDQRRARLINFLGELKDVGELRPPALTQRH